MIDRLDDLERLDRLRRDGSISEGEFQREKASLLGTSKPTMTFRLRAKVIVGVLTGTIVLIALAVAVLVLIPAPRRAADDQPTPTPVTSATPLTTPPLAPASLRPDFTLPEAPTAIVQLDCHMDQCAWQQIVGLSVIKAVDDATLVKVNSRIGTSDHSPADGDNEYPSSYDPKLNVSWEAQTGYLLCSKLRPAEISWDSDSKVWSAWFLNVVNPSGAEFSSVNEYMQVCHDLAPNRWTASDVKGMGYPDRDGGQVTLNAPEDVLTYLNRP